MKSPRTTVAVLAVACALGTLPLAGCTVGPLELPDVPGLESLADLRVGMPELTVAEARAQRVAALSPAVGASDLAQENTLTVGLLVGNTAPLVISSGADGKAASGIDVDTAYALADALGLPNVSFKAVASAAEGLANGCDVVMGVSAAEAGASATVLGNYAQDALGVFGKADSGSAPAQATASDLAGKTVAVQAGSASQTYLMRSGLSYSEKPVTNLNEAFEALAAGEADYVVCDAYSGAYLACLYEGVGFAGSLNDAEALGVAVASPDSVLGAAVGAALDQIQANGVAALAKQRWVGELPEVSASTLVGGLDGASADSGTDAADDAEPSADAEATPAE